MYHGLINRTSVLPLWEYDPEARSSWAQKILTECGPCTKCSLRRTRNPPPQVIGSVGLRAGLTARLYAHLLIMKQKRGFRRSSEGMMHSGWPAIASNSRNIVSLRSRVPRNSSIVLTFSSSKRVFFFKSAICWFFFVISFFAPFSNTRIECSAWFRPRSRWIRRWN